MSIFIMLTELSHDKLANPRSFENWRDQIDAHLERECPQVRWLSSFIALGPADCVDIFTAPDNSTAAKVSTIVRSFGQATTEIWPAMDWKDFRHLLRELPPAIIAG